MKKITNFATILMVSTMLQSQTTIFVKPDGAGDGTSWANACNLEEAISVIERSRNDPDASAPLSDRTEIWVQKGTHYPTKMLIIPVSVKVYGGFSGTETALSQRNFSANPTIIDGQNKIGSIFRLENSAEINGLTIQNGNANGKPQKNGGGVWADENTVIENCKIINNAATANGGGVYAKGEVKIINGIVENNTADGNGADLYGSCITQVSMPVATGCNDATFDFGTIKFETTKETTITGIVDGQPLTQVWSDAVTATNCQKTTYNGGSSGNYNTDCKANSYPGDLFSWCAVARFADILCPEPWRVPTKDDFINLDKTFGGTGINRTGAFAMLPSYIGTGSNQWSGVYGGCCIENGSQLDRTTHAYYCSQSEQNADYGYYITLCSRNGAIVPQNSYYKHHGFALRCVR